MTGGRSLSHRRPEPERNHGADAMLILPDSPENELLLSCARIGNGRDVKEEVERLVKSNLNWDYVVEKAHSHHLASFLYYDLSKLSEHAVPEDVLSKLKRRCAVTAARNLRFQHELVKILDALERRGISMVLLKGAALVQIVYRDLTLRPMADIDVLVRERDFRGIQTALHEIGYYSPSPLPNLTDKGLVEYAHCFDQVRFCRKDGVAIETHFRLLNMGSPTGEQPSVWERALPVRIDGVKGLIPCPEDMLLHLCFHANHHRFSKIYLFRDIAEVLSHYSDRFDWEYLLRVVDLRRMKASIYYTLLFADEVSRYRVPSDVLERLRPGYLRRKVFECIWKGLFIKCMNRLELHNLQGPIYYVLEMDGLREKLAFLAKSLFPPVQWLSVRFCVPESKTLYLRYLLTVLKRCLRPAT